MTAHFFHMNLKMSTNVGNDMFVVYFCFEHVITFFGVSPNKTVSWVCFGKSSIEIKYPHSINDLIPLE